MPIVTSYYLETKPANSERNQDRSPTRQFDVATLMDRA